MVVLPYSLSCHALPPDIWSAEHLKDTSWIPEKKTLLAPARCLWLPSFRKPAHHDPRRSQPTTVLRSAFTFLSNCVSHKLPQVSAETILKGWGKGKAHLPVRRISLASSLQATSGEKNVSQKKHISSCKAVIYHTHTANLRNMLPESQVQLMLIQARQ